MNIFERLVSDERSKFCRNDYFQKISPWENIELGIKPARPDIYRFGRKSNPKF